MRARLCGAGAGPPPALALPCGHDEVIVWAGAKDVNFRSPDREAHIREASTHGEDVVHFEDRSSSHAILSSRSSPPRTRSQPFRAIGVAYLLAEAPFPGPSADQVAPPEQPDGASPTGHSDQSEHRQITGGDRSLVEHRRRVEVAEHAQVRDRGQVRHELGDRLQKEHEDERPGDDATRDAPAKPNFQ
jgi:hypothetical protein